MENVPGLLSSQEGRDFAVLIRGLDELGYVGIWKTLNSQYFGIPQRRRRIFLIGHLGRKCPSEILLITEGLRGNSPKGRAAGESASADVAPSLTGSGRGVERTGESRGQDPVVCVPDRMRLPISGHRAGALQHALPGSQLEPETLSGLSDSRVVASVSSKWSKGTEGPSGDECQNLIVGALATNSGPRSHDAGNFHCNQAVDAGHIIAHTLRGRSFDGSEDGTGRGTPLVTIGFSCKDHGADASEIAPTLRSMEHDKSHLNGGGQVAICFESRFVRNGRGSPEEICQPLKAESGKTNKGDSSPLLAGTFGVRRLTPTECERLQGFPDGHTAWGIDNGKRVEMSDSQRYRQLGNAVSVPVAEWIGKQIMETL